MKPDITQGEHVPSKNFDQLSPGYLGTKENPYIHVSQGFCDENFPYGAWCVCSSCGLLGRSTFVFDFYTAEDDTLLCEYCCRKTW